MRAVRFSEAKGLRVEDVPVPTPAANEVLIRVLRAGICSTDLEIIRGYVGGFDHTLGHEFVGVVEAAPPGNAQSFVGKRVVGEINCRCGEIRHPDPIFIRNHAPSRVVLGIIGKDGAMAKYVTLPVENIHIVPDEDHITDQEACFAEPLAAAYRIVEQGLVNAGASPFSTKLPAVAVIGDGKLGLLIAHVLARHREKTQTEEDEEGNAPPLVTLFGRHTRKMELVQGVLHVVLTASSTQNLPTEFVGGFDVVVEASGSPQGVKTALALTRPLGTVVMKSTCSAVPSSKSSLGGEGSPVGWTDLANDVVVNEKRIVGSRCGPFLPALTLLREPATKALVNSMVDVVLPLEEGVEAVATHAQRKGALKVQLVCT